MLVRRRQTCKNFVKGNDMGKKKKTFHVCNPIKFRWLKNMAINLYTVCTQVLHNSARANFALSPLKQPYHLHSLAVHVI